MIIACCSLNKFSHFLVDIVQRVWHDNCLLNLFWQNHVHAFNLIFANLTMLDFSSLKLFSLLFILFLLQNVSSHGLLLVSLGRLIRLSDPLLLLSGSLEHFLQCCNMLETCMRFLAKQISSREEAALESYCGSLSCEFVLLPEQIRDNLLALLGSLCHHATRSTRLWVHRYASISATDWQRIMTIDNTCDTSIQSTGSIRLLIV